MIVLRALRRVFVVSSCVLTGALLAVLVVSFVGSFIFDEDWVRRAVLRIDREIRSLRAAGRSGADAGGRPRPSLEARDGAAAVALPRALEWRIDRAKAGLGRTPHGADAGPGRTSCEETLDALLPALDALCGARVDGWRPLEGIGDLAERRSQVAAAIAPASGDAADGESAWLAGLSRSSIVAIVDAADGPGLRTGRPAAARGGAHEPRSTEPRAESRRDVRLLRELDAERREQVLGDLAKRDPAQVLEIADALRPERGGAATSSGRPHPASPPRAADAPAPGSDPADPPATQED